MKHNYTELISDIKAIEWRAKNGAVLLKKLAITHIKNNILWFLFKFFRKIVLTISDVILNARLQISRYGSRRILDYMGSKTQTNISLKKNKADWCNI